MYGNKDCIIPVYPTNNLHVMPHLNIILLKFLIYRLNVYSFNGYHGSYVWVGQERKSLEKRYY